MTFLENLQWRNATKLFDTEKKVSHDDLRKILESIHMAPTSFGLQPFTCYVVTDDEKRVAIQEASWGQPQVTSCSHLLVFTIRKDTIEKWIDLYFDTASGGNSDARKTMEEYENMMRGFMEPMSKEQVDAWAKNQAYIALWFAMAACAELHVDSCPMEGFDPVKTHEILGLWDDVMPVVMLPIGHRAAEPEHPKVRLPMRHVIDSDGCDKGANDCKDWACCK